ncbi:spore germination protein GerM [Thalassobacillus devorans]|uniref:Spore germination protein GerM n=1 Tax=Thalassobacillus devorans TaxID=279813 RepID=A0ABQ1P995_9BACI|nr:GerMN domain-containing protein [Thalassobacillus devorans]NIK29829.1 germination protein M [Thalassobacillus devorans]GGC93168.1 spore germination protein GerM [Thalassobacillus devorans]
MKMRVIGSLVIGLSTTLLLTGCFFEGEQSIEKMDAPQDVDYVDQTDEAADKTTEDSVDDTNSEANEEATGTSTRQLYLLDANGMVVSQTLELPNISSKEVATQSLEYLVKGGPVTELLPNGFEAVLPAGTEILGLNLKEDGTMIVDVSKEFAEYAPEDEQKILQAMTYTLTQFENVERIKLWINGHEQEVMPVKGTPISSGVSRADGINIYASEDADVVDSKAVTLYYPAQNENQDFYYVPVTTHLNTSDNDSYESIVQALVEGPSFDLPLLTAFNEEAELLETSFENGVLSLSFNEALLSNQEKQSVSEHVMKSLVMTLTDQQGVEAVEVHVDGVEQVYSEDGVPYAEPVTINDITGADSL